MSQSPAALETTARVLKIADVALGGAAKIADKQGLRPDFPAIPGGGK